MEHEAVIEGLLEKRAEIERDIADLERLIRVKRSEMAQLDATIQLFAPSVVAAKRERTKFKRSVYFSTGELTRHCQDCLREADGRAITAHEMATTALHQKGLDAGDGDLRLDFIKRVTNTLNRMLRTGAVTKEGYGASARWGLPKE